MHRATTAAAVAGLLSEKLGHHALHIGALGDAVAVATVRRGDVVVLVEGETSAGRYSLLADREVHGAVHEPTAVQVFHCFFKAADLPHGGEAGCREFAVRNDLRIHRYRLS